MTEVTWCMRVAGGFFEMPSGQLFSNPLDRVAEIRRKVCAVADQLAIFPPLVVILLVVRCLGAQFA